jgi:hypothetical protein
MGDERLQWEIAFERTHRIETPRPIEVIFWTIDDVHRINFRGHKTATKCEKGDSAIKF